MAKRLFGIFTVTVVLLTSCLSSQRRMYADMKAAFPQPTGSFFLDLPYSDNGSQCQLDIYHPQLEAAAWKRDPAPVYVFIHGGSWLVGSKEFIRYFNDWLLEPIRAAGAAVVSIGYRFYGQTSFPSISKDIHDAMEFLRAHADEYRLDMDCAVIHGQSAGAHLAMMEAFRFPQGIRLILNEYGPSDLVEMQKAQPIVGIVSQKIRRQESPTTYVSGNVPPMIIYHGNADTMVPLSQSQLLVDKLKPCGASVKLNLIEGGDHGFVNQSPETREEIYASIRSDILSALGL